MLTDYQLLILIIILFSAVSFVLIFKLSTQGIMAYRGYFVQKVDYKLKNMFLFKDLKRLFLMHLLIIFMGTILGFIYSGIIGLLIGGILTVSIPGVVLGYVKKRRVKHFIYQLPDALGSISASLRAGSNLPRAIEQVADQQPHPLCQEFTVILSEYKMGRNLEDSFADMYRRIHRQEVDLLISAISISKNVGGNLAITLETLAKTLREKAQIEGKIEALTAMGRMQGWVVGCVPVVVIVMLRKQEPEGMQVLFNEPIGWLVLGVIALLMAIAIIMIRKIVNIDI